MVIYIGIFYKLKEESYYLYCFIYIIIKFGIKFIK